jgi:hypothetical protein
MKDLIDHMERCHDQLQWTGDGPTQDFLTESLMVDLTECRRLCEQLQDLRGGASAGRAVAITA